jgi:hypothetical protein
MRVVLTDLWENERRVSSPDKSPCRAICQAHKPSETHLESVTEKGDRSQQKVVVFLRERILGAGQVDDRRNPLPIRARPPSLSWRSFSEN